MLDYTHCLSNLCRQTFGSLPSSIIRLSGDGSDRRYFRISYCKESFIGVISSDVAENRAFLSFTDHFACYGLPVPKILSYADDLSCYLIEDFGDVLLCDYVVEKQQQGLQDAIRAQYHKVLDLLPRFQIEAGRSLDYSLCYQSAKFDFSAVMKDLYYFRRCFLSQFCKISFDENTLEKDFKQFALRLSKVNDEYFLYRDFQSRNILIVGNAPHFIDYQSGRRGALQYDVASLLFDANVELGEKLRIELLDYYLDVLSKYDAHIDPDIFRFYYYDFALVRVMQALAAFSFLAREKGKRQFLNSIPPALKSIDYLLVHSQKLKELHELRRLLEHIVQHTEIH